MGKKELTNPLNSMYGPENELVDSLKHKFSDPGLKSQLREWTSNSITYQRHKIVAIRSGDVLSILGHLVKGGFTVDHKGDNTFMSKEPEWFYVTPVYEHSFFNLDSINHEDRSQSGFYDAVEANIKYGKQHAFAAAFMRFVEPELIEGWDNKLKPLVESYNLFIAGTNDDSLIIEDFLDQLGESIDKVAQRQESIISYLKHPSTKTGRFLIGLQQVMKPDADFVKYLDLLQEVSGERAGAMIGFNSSVIQGDWISDRSITDRYRHVIHSFPEMAINPPDGIILTTGCIEAIEPLGDYEVEIINQMLGD